MALVNEAHCPNFHDHTAAPEGYLAWHAWAAKKARTHKQEKCSGCGLYAIWVPRSTPSEAYGPGEKT